MVFLPRTGQGWIIDVNGDDWKFDPFGRLLDRPDPGPYDPCWCASGRKFRFCHRDRHKLPRITNAEFLKGWEASAELEMCLHPTALEGCSETIVRAHTVQRMGGGLRSIARAGEVYGFKHHPSFFQKYDLRLIKPDLIGTRKASTFRGFCEAHDASLFAAAEAVPFQATQEQLLLLNFRTVAKRLFGMRAAVRHAQLMLTYDRGLPPLVQREWFAIHHRELVNDTEAVRNLTCLKSTYDEWVTGANFRSTNGFVVHFEGMPDFQCAEIVAIRFDFEGRRLCEPEPPAHMCAYTVAVDDGWMFIFSWTGDNAAAELLVTSFLNVPDEEKGSRVLRYALEYTDNLFFAPRWWDALSDTWQLAMAKTLTDRLHSHYVHDPEMLVTKPVPSLTAKYRSTRKIGPWCSAA
jgi:hypothetical protein